MSGEPVIPSLIETFDGWRSRALAAEAKLAGQAQWLENLLAKEVMRRSRAIDQDRRVAEQAATIERLTEALNYWGLNSLISDPKYRRRAEAKLVRDRIDAALNPAKPSEPEEQNP